MADTEVKQELVPEPNPARAQERPRFVRQQRDPAKQAQIDQAWAELEAARKRVSARFAGHSEEELDALVDELVQETRDEMFEERCRRYESDQPS